MNNSQKRFTSSVGKSKITSYKQYCLKSILQENIKKSKQVFKKHQDKHWLNNTYYAFDLTAGDAQDFLSSPRIFIGEAVGQQLDFGLHLFEKNKITYSILTKNLKKHLSYLNLKTLYENGIFCYDINFITSDVIEYNGKWHLGLCYFDPNGCGNKVEYDFLEKFTHQWPQIDLLLNISIHQWKRAFHNKDCKRNDLLSDQLKKLNKKEWWIRQMVADNKRWNFIMIFGTNMNNYTLSHLDFHKICLDNLEDPCYGNYLVDEYDKYIQAKTKRRKQ